MWKLLPDVVRFTTTESNVKSTHIHRRERDQGNIKDWLCIQRRFTFLSPKISNILKTTSSFFSTAAALAIQTKKLFKQERQKEEVEVSLGRKSCLYLFSQQ